MNSLFQIGYPSYIKSLVLFKVIANYFLYCKKMKKTLPGAEHIFVYIFNFFLCVKFVWLLAVCTVFLYDKILEDEGRALLVLLVIVDFQ